MSKKKRKKNAKSPISAESKQALPKDAVTTPDEPGQTISLCMMVKNEEENLPRALNSVKDWVDEIIVVDTGSSDRTVEIAQSYGAKIYHHPWENDFAKHRNQSISYATGEWLLILDADEELDQETAPQLRELTKAPPGVNGLLFELYNDVTAGGQTFVLHPRMFRNNNGFHYQGKVHNKPTVVGQIARTYVRLIHYGYNMDPATMQAKHKRRVDMIQKWVDEEPDNYLAHSYLAHTLLSQDESRARAVEVAQTALKLLRQTPGEENRYPHVYYPIINGLTLLGRDEELIKEATECLEVAPYYPDPLYFMVWVDYKHQRWEDVCRKSANFLELQDRCRESPDEFIFFENMTYDQMNMVLMRWVVAAAQLNREDEAKQAMQKVIHERGGEEAAKSAVLTLLNSGQTQLALELAELAGQAQEDWSWPENIMRLGSQKSQEEQAVQLLKNGQNALQQGQTEKALSSLQKAFACNPNDYEIIMSLARALEQAGKLEEAEIALIKGLNAHPGHAWAWQRLAETCLARKDHAGAAACLERYLKQSPADQAAKSSLAACLEQPTPPTVAQQPPRLAVFLVGGLTPELVRMPAPHFLIGTAWGEFLANEGPQPDSANWASLYTGARPEVHGLRQEAGFGNPLSVDQLNTPAFWQVLGPEIRVGLAAAPLTTPPPQVKGWALSGFPGGLLSPDLVRPAELAPRVLAAGFRTDFALNEFDLQTAPQRIENDIRQEGLLLQNERSKMIAAARLPAVDLLVIGFSALEYMQKARELATYQMYSAYQQVYGWIETFLAGVQPQAFAIFSQRGYQRQGFSPERGGFYCMSWLRGENGKANITDAAGEIVRFLGGEPGRLGQPKN